MQFLQTRVGTLSHRSVALVVAAAITAHRKCLRDSVIERKTATDNERRKQRLVRTLHKLIKAQHYKMRDTLTIKSEKCRAAGLRRASRAQHHLHPTTISVFIIIAQASHIGRLVLHQKDATK